MYIHGNGIFNRFFFVFLSTLSLFFIHPPIHQTNKIEWDFQFFSSMYITYSIENKINFSFLPSFTHISVFEELFFLLFFFFLPIEVYIYIYRQDVDAISVTITDEHYTNITFRSTTTIHRYISQWKEQYNHQISKRKIHGIRSWYAICQRWYQ